MTSQRSTVFLFLIVLLLLGSIRGLLWANYQFSNSFPGGYDFRPRWMGAHKWLIEGMSPYDERISLETQEFFFGQPANLETGQDRQHFVYPLYSMIFFAPFGLMEYTLARGLWMTLLEISLIAMVFVSLKLVNWRVPLWKIAFLIFFSLIWYYGGRNIILGQFAVINSFLIVVSLLFIQRKQDLAAGFLLALSTIKPQMTFLLLPFVLIWSISVKRYALVFGVIGGFTGLMVISLALIPDWPIQMLSQLIEYPSYTPLSSPLSIIADLMPGIKDTLNSVLHGVFVLYLFVEWGLAWGKGYRWFLWTALLTLVITLMVALRSGETQFIVVLPAIFLIFRVWEERWKLWGQIVVWIALLVLLIGPWWLFLQTIQGNQEYSVLFLPLPFFCLFGLWWIRWWLIHPPRLMLEEMAARVE